MPQCLQTDAQFRVARIYSTGLSHDHNINSGKIISRDTKIFSAHPSDTIAIDRIPDALFGNSKTETCVWEFIFSVQQREESISAAPRVLKDTIELPGGQESETTTVSLVVSSRRRIP